MAGTEYAGRPDGPLSVAALAAKRAVLADAIQRFHGNRAQIAAYLGVRRANLYRLYANAGVALPPVPLGRPKKATP